MANFLTPMPERLNSLTPEQVQLLMDELKRLIDELAEISKQQGQISRVKVAIHTFNKKTEL